MNDAGVIPVALVAVRFLGAVVVAVALVVASLAEELVELQVDVIVAPTPQPARAAVDATRAIPIVFVAVADPVALGLVRSLARPGGNVTGVTSSASEAFPGKVLELLKEVVPGVSRVAVLANPTNAMHTQIISKDLVGPARTLRVTIVPVEARSAGDFDAAFSAAMAQKAEGLWVLGDPLTFGERARAQLAQLSARHRLPTIYFVRENVEAGGLMSYGPVVVDLYRRAAYLVDKILKGAKPADLPVEQPTRFELVVNTRTAKALGLSIPPSLLLRGDQVIE